MHLAGIGAHQNGRMRAHVQARLLPSSKSGDTLTVPLPLPTSQADEQYERATSCPDGSSTIIGLRR
jgi:hypothetical protein